MPRRLSSLEVAQIPLRLQEELPVWEACRPQVLEALGQRQELHPATGGRTRAKISNKADMALLHPAPRKLRTALPSQVLPLSQV